MIEKAVYNSEDSKWYRMGDDPWTVRFVKVGDILKPLVFAIATTYTEAFEQLFGHPVPIPPPVRAPRRESAFEVKER